MLAPGPPLPRSKVWFGPPLHVPFVTVAVTLPAISNSNPVGTVRMIVLFGPPISPTAPSVMIGPVNAVNVPPVVLASIAEPPVAAVTVFTASADGRNAGSDSTKDARTIFPVSTESESPEAALRKLRDNKEELDIRRGEKSLLHATSERIVIRF